MLLATTDLSRRTKKSTWIIHSAVTELAKTCWHPLQILVQRTSSDCKGVLLLARKNCPPKSANTWRAQWGAREHNEFLVNRKHGKFLRYIMKDFLLSSVFAWRPELFETGGKKEKSQAKEKKKKWKAAHSTIFMYWYWNSRLIQFSPILIHLLTFKKQTETTKPKETPHIEGSCCLAALDAFRLQHAVKQVTLLTQCSYSQKQQEDSPRINFGVNS